MKAAWTTAPAPQYRGWKILLPSEQMTSESANTHAKIDQAMVELKTKIPPPDHSALESRMHALLNDPDIDDNDVISILRQEFDPARE